MKFFTKRSAGVKRTSDERLVVRGYPVGTRFSDPADLSDGQSNDASPRQQDNWLFASRRGSVKLTLHHALTVAASGRILADSYNDTRTC